MSNFNHQYKIGHYLFWYNTDPCEDVQVQDLRGGTDLILIPRNTLIAFVEHISMLYKCKTCGNDFNIKDMITVREGLPPFGINTRAKPVTSKTFCICKECNLKEEKEDTLDERLEKEICKMLDGKWNMPNGHKMAIRTGYSKEEDKNVKRRLRKIARNRKLKVKIELPTNRKLSNTWHVTFEKKKEKV